MARNKVDKREKGFHMAGVPREIPLVSALSGTRAISPIVVPVNPGSKPIVTAVLSTEEYIGLTDEQKNDLKARGLSWARRVEKLSSKEIASPEKVSATTKESKK